MPSTAIYHEPNGTVIPSFPANTTSNKWGPYSGSGDFTINMVIILMALLAALGLALAVNALIKYLFCHQRRQQQSENSGTQKPPRALSVQLPETIYKSGPDEDAAECAICLSEYVNGDRIRVLPACGHGFHVKCIEKWINGGGSCPTCRARCDVGPTTVKNNVSAGCGV